MAPTLEETGIYVCQVRLVAATLDPEGGLSAARQQRFVQLREGFAAAEDEIYEHFAKVMASWECGLFAGADLTDVPLDNLDLERWFREPKGHERRINGRQHTGVRIVQEGATLVLALDAHLQHPEPFGEADLSEYRNATAPACERQAVHRRKVMRKARSRKKRGPLLADLEARYARLQ